MKKNRGFGSKKTKPKQSQNKAKWRPLAGNPKHEQLISGLEIGD